MTDSELISYVRAYLPSNSVDRDTDATVLVFLDIAAKKIIARAYPYDNTVTAVPPQYETLQAEIAAYLMNKRGAEGETSHTENGITRQYQSADVPSSMMNIIVPFCSVPKESDS